MTTLTRMTDRRPALFGAEHLTFRVRGPGDGFYAESCAVEHARAHGLEIKVFSASYSWLSGWTVRAEIVTRR